MVDQTRLGYISLQHCLVEIVCPDILSGVVPKALKIREVYIRVRALQRLSSHNSASHCESWDGWAPIFLTHYYI